MVNEVEFKKANNYSLKCMRVTFIVLVIAWVLNVMHIFIVDQTIMNTALIGVAIFLVLGHAAKYVIGFEKAISNYIMLFFAGGYDFLCEYGTGLSCIPIYDLSYGNFHCLY